MGTRSSGRQTRVVVPMTVEPEDTTIGLSHPNQLRDGIGQCVKLPLAYPKCRFDTFAFGDLLGCDIDTYDLAIRPPDRMPVGDPRAVIDLVGALPGDLDPGYRLAGCHDGADDRFDRFSQCRYALSHRSPQMPLDGNPAYFGEALVNVQVAAVGR